MRRSLRLFTAAGITAILAPTESPADVDARQVEIVAHGKKLVRLDTSNPPGNETLVATYLRDLLAKEGIAAEIFEKEEERGKSRRALYGNDEPIWTAGLTPFFQIEWQGVTDVAAEPESTKEHLP